MITSGKIMNDPLNDPYVQAPADGLELGKVNEGRSDRASDRASDRVGARQRRREERSARRQQRRSETHSSRSSMSSRVAVDAGMCTGSVRVWAGGGWWWG